MIISLLAGIILGLILALPPGPVTVTAIKTGLNKGLRDGVFIGLGNGIIDFTYCLGAVFATSAALMLIDNFAHDYPLIVLSFQLVVVLGIMIYGFTHLKPKKSFIIDDSDPLTKKNQKLQFLSSKGPFFLGLAVALTNIANPTFLTSLAYLTMQVQKFGLIENSNLGNLAFAFGFAIGNVFWIYVVVRTITHYKSKLSDKMVMKIQKFAGVTLIGFGTILGLRIVELTKWSEIVRLLLAF